jgi:nucleosome binding factor SPN SPT16 subunit
LLIFLFTRNSIWLLSYEFSDTIVLFTRNKVVFAVSAKKKALLDDMKKPDDYGGPEVEIVQKDSKTENLGEFIDNLLTTNIKSGNNVAMFKKND